MSDVSLEADKGISRASKKLLINLDGAHKVAALMLALYPLDEIFVGKLLKRFTKPELLKITESASDLGAITPDILSGLMEELSSAMTSGPGVLGSQSEAQNLLRVALPDASIDMLKAPEPDLSEPEVWNQLAKLNVKTLTALLEEELPQVAAYILSKMPSATISQCMELLPRDKSGEILARFVQIGNVGPIADACIEEALAGISSSEVKEEGSQESKIAESLNFLDANVAGELMDGLRERRPEQAASIAKSMFDFKDFVVLSQTARQSVMQGVDSELLIVALNGEPKETQDAFLSTMGARARKMIEQELNDARPQAAKNIEAAQKTISNKIITMIRNGEISREAEG